MKRKQSVTSTALLWAFGIAAGALIMGTGPANAQDGILLKVQAGETNYCHLKFPAIRPETLSSDRPVLQNPSTGTIIDFYGPCNYDPTGKAAVKAQKLDQQHLRNRQYGS